MFVKHAGSPAGFSDRRFALSIALITILAPTATDLYLASMPDIAKALHTSYANVQISLTVFLLAQGLGQIFFGPVIDRFGRRTPLLLGLLAFILSSIWGGLSQSIESLVLSRFIQGLAGSLLLVVSFSSVRDVADGSRAARLFALLLTIEGLAPVFAPMAGGYLDAYFGWRVVLWTSAAMGLCALANSWIALPETLPEDRRIPLRPGVLWANYKRIATDRNFMLPTLALSGVFFFLFAYISGGAYLYQGVFGLTPDEFGLIFGITGGAVMTGAFVSGRLVRRHMVADIAVISVVLIIAGVCAAALASRAVGVYGLVPGFMLALFGLGMAETTLLALTMASQKTALGFTSALMGCMHLVLSSLSTPISGYLLPKSMGAWFMFLLASTLVTLALALAARANLRKAAKKGDELMEPAAS
jgi:drug resistance transporter, Bcr/CflA subfamily